MLNESDQNLMPRVQTVGSLFGLDWNKIWSVFQKISPALREIITTILEATQEIQQLNMPTLPGAHFSVLSEDVGTLAKEIDVSPSDLMDILSAVSPLTAQLIMKMLANKNLQVL